MIVDPLVRQAFIIRFKTHLLFSYADLREAYLDHPDASEYLRGRTRIVDETLISVWDTFIMPQNMVLVAIGGYGRGELYPASDIDLLILLDIPPDDEHSELLKDFIALLWDIGLKVSHSVRTTAQCLDEAPGDLNLQTALTEARLLAGNSPLFSGFINAFTRSINLQSFFHAKRIEQEDRHRRFHDTPNSLEPNCKEGPGGLRDLQTILWIAQAAGYGKRWKDLYRRGMITQHEQRSLEKSEGFLQHLRILLHLRTRRQEDRLLFDYQGVIAAQLDFKDTPGRRASEQLMQKYYRTANAVLQGNVILLQNMAVAIFPLPKQTPQIINERFQSVHQLLDIGNENLFEEKPEAIFELFLVLQRHSSLKGISARTMRALWHARELVDKNFRDNPENKKNFIEIFKQPRGVLHALRRMNQFDILGRYLPLFGQIVGQMQHDLFHAYTVDQHILLVLRNLRRFSEDEFAHEYPFCSRLISNLDRPWRLYIAALFHDIAKGRGGNHSERGAIDTQKFCDSHSLLPDETQLIVWLVKNHLLMSSVAQKQDISDPDVLTAFAAEIPDEEHLVMLYLLTVADIRATGPTLWNTWKGQLLETLFKQTLRILQDGGKPPARQGITRERLNDALKILAQKEIPIQAHQRLWEELDTVYFLRHTAEEIAWHVCALYGDTEQYETPVVKARFAPPTGENIQVMVYTHDQPELFIKLVGYLSAAGYNILDAKIHTTEQGYALDSFILQDAHCHEHEENVLIAIEKGLVAALTKKQTQHSPPNARLSRELRHFPMLPEVSITPDDKGTHYILSVSAADRPGLLYTVATTLTAFDTNLHTAQIATLGQRVEDTFLITGEDLAHSAVRMKLETTLLELLKT